MISSVLEYAMSRYCQFCSFTREVYDLNSLVLLLMFYFRELSWDNLNRFFICQIPSRENNFNFGPRLKIQTINFLFIRESEGQTIHSAPSAGDHKVHFPQHIQSITTRSPCILFSLRENFLDINTL